MRRPDDDDEAPPGGRAAERLREQLRDRFGDDPALWPEAARAQLESAVQGAGALADEKPLKNEDR